MADNNANKPTFDDELRIAMQFPRPFFEAWEDEATRSLKGRPLASLDVTTHEGLVIKPVYSTEDLPPDLAAIDGFREGPATVACPIDLRDPKGTCHAAFEHTTLASRSELCHKSR